MNTEISWTPDYVDEGKRHSQLEEETCQRLQARCSVLERHRDEAYFGVHWIENNNGKTKFYTGLPSFSAFSLLCTYLSGKAAHLKEWRSDKSVACLPTDQRLGPQPWKDMSIEDQCFAVLVHLRLELSGADAAARFRMSESTYSRVFATWVVFLSKELKLLFPWPSRARIDHHMPAAIKRRFPTTRVIIDCMEIQIERPTSLINQAVTYSNYKSRNTMKFWIGVSPSGLVTFVSDAWGGRSSDKAITEQNGILDLLDKGDSVMADKGFDIEELLAPRGVRLNAPPKLGKETQVSGVNVEKTRRIAELRIHVERAIGRARNYSILNKIFPVSK